MLHGETELEQCEIGNLYYTFDPNKSLASSIFSERTCKLIASYRDSRFARTLYVLNGFIYLALFGMDLSLTPLFSIWIILSTLLILIPFQMAWLLAANQYAFHKVVQTFEFWIKVSQIFGIILLSGYIECVYLGNQYNLIESPTLHMAHQCLLFPGTLSLVTLTAALDAVPYIEKKLQVLICSLICLVFLAASISDAMSWIYGDLGDFSLIRLNSTLSFSIAEITVNMQRTISLFYAKQTFSLILRVRSGSSKAVSLKYTPDIEWKAIQGTTAINVQINSESERASPQLPKSQPVDCKKPIHTVIQLK